MTFHEDTQVSAQTLFRCVNLRCETRAEKYMIYLSLHVSGENQIKVYDLAALRCL